MGSVLLVTVGGSPEPILTAIQTLAPERVVFLCSDRSRSQVEGQGYPCQIVSNGQLTQRLPNLPTQAGLGDRFQLVELEPDNLQQAYTAIAQTIRDLQAELGNRQLQADYTGGTKTMSVALGMAANDCGVPLFLTTGERRNIERVTRDELTGPVAADAVTVQRRLDSFLTPMLQNYDYAAAIGELRSMRAAHNLPPALAQRVQALYGCCLGFEAWDRFDHQGAWERLSGCMKWPELRSRALSLKCVLKSRAQIDPEFETDAAIDCHGYEVVEDLLRNAERRAHQQRYDDAVARLYRSLELLAQVRLGQAYGIQTANVDPALLPEAVQAWIFELRASPDWPIQLGLAKSYELLARLADPLGNCYQEQANAINDALQVRNYSILAHGFRPIDRDNYQYFQGKVAALVQSGIEACLPEGQSSASLQFPQQLTEIL